MIGRSNDIISSIDVYTAFLQSDEYKSTDLIRYVYYQARSSRGGAKIYYILRGCLYGQRTASMEWYRTLTTYLVSKGFRAGKNDPCLCMYIPTLKPMFR